jgi:hypothetical protein
MLALSDRRVRFSSCKECLHVAHIVVRAGWLPYSLPSISFSVGTLESCEPVAVQTHYSFTYKGERVVVIQRISLFPAILRKT